jgi:hypothetical protein
MIRVIGTKVEKRYIKDGKSFTEKEETYMMLLEDNDDIGFYEMKFMFEKQGVIVDYIKKIKMNEFEVLDWAMGVLRSNEFETWSIDEKLEFAKKYGL